MGKVFTVPSVIIIDTAAAVAQEDCFVWGQPVWPDVGVKKLPNVSKSCRNNFHISFIHKLIYFKIARKTPIFLGYFCKQICWQELSKVAQSGHTGWPTNAIRRDSFFIKWNKVTFTKSYHLLRKKNIRGTDSRMGQSKMMPQHVFIFHITVKHLDRCPGPDPLKEIFDQTLHSVFNCSEWQFNIL